MSDRALVKEWLRRADHDGRRLLTITKPNDQAAILATVATYRRAATELSRGAAYEDDEYRDGKVPFTLLAVFP